MYRSAVMILSYLLLNLGINFMLVLDRKTVLRCQRFKRQMVLCWAKYTLEIQM